MTELLDGKHTYPIGSVLISQETVQKYFYSLSVEEQTAIKLQHGRALYGWVEDKLLPRGEEQDKFIRWCELHLVPLVDALRGDNNE